MRSLLHPRAWLLADRKSGTDFNLCHALKIGNVSAAFPVYFGYFVATATISKVNITKLKIKK
jgi:hypothetical protein